MIRLNIVTIVKDDNYSLELTIKSALNLAICVPKIYFVHYIQDGSLNNYKEKYFLRLKNKPRGNYKIIYSRARDSGIYDAMNKVNNKFQSGDLIIYMNAGDIFYNKINYDKFFYAIKDFNERSETICFFRSLNIYKNIYYFMPPKSIKNTDNFIAWVKNYSPVHQSIIFKFSDLYPLHYDNSFRIQADQALIYKILNNFSKPVFYNFQISNFSLGGYSGNYRSLKKVICQFREQILIMKMRGQKKFYFRTFIIFAIKYGLHNLLKDNFFIFHARINKFFKS